MMARTITASLMTLLAGVAIAGCGESESFDVRTPTSTQSTANASTAEPTTASGVFKLVPKAPRGYEDLAGTAKLVRSDRGTGASITLAGLEANVEYASHVHAGPCDQPDPGGPHFKFDLNGSDLPPNEIHLPFTSDDTGNGSAKATNDQTVPEGEGRSIVVHRAAAAKAAGSANSKQAGGGSHHGSGSSASAPAAAAATPHAHPPKIACAPLDSPSPATSTGTASEPGTVTIDVKDKQPVGGIQKLSVRKGEQVRFTVTSDQAEEVHTHGYDTRSSSRTPECRSSA